MPAELGEKQEGRQLGRKPIRLTTIDAAIRHDVAVDVRAVFPLCFELRFTKGALARFLKRASGSDQEAAEEERRLAA